MRLYLILCRIKKGLLLKPNYKIQITNYKLQNNKTKNKIQKQNTKTKHKNKTQKQNP